MNSTWQSLFWKEWREQRAVALAILVVLLVIPPLSTLVELGDLYAGLSGTLLLAVPFFALFVGVGIAAGEQSRGTIPFLRALPTPSWNAALVKLLVAIATLAIPIVITVAFYYLYNLVSHYFGDADVVGTETVQDLYPAVWGISNYFINAAVASCLIAVSIICWATVGGVNRRDEISAGAMAGVTIASAYLFMGIGAWMAWGLSPSFSHTIQPLLAAFPGGVGWISADQKPGPWNPTAYFLTAAVVALLSHGALVWWFVTRYGRVVPGKTETAPPVPEVTATQSWLNAPRRSIFTALVWKQFRELFAIVAVGMAVIVSIILVVCLVKISYGDTIKEHEYFDLPFGAWLMVEFFVAVVIGVGVFLEDLKPGLYNFWRSRPIPIDRWFWTKFSIGLLACLAPVCIPLLGWVLQGMLFYGVDISRWSVSRYGDSQTSTKILSGLLVHTGLYCSAVLAMSVLRRPVLAAVCAPPLLIGTLVLLGKIGEWADIPEPGAWLFGTLCLTPCAVVAILAWQAIRRNWSLERFMT